MIVLDTSGLLAALDSAQRVHAASLALALGVFPAEARYLVSVGGKRESSR